jgi:hypothetical protein
MSHSEDGKFTEPDPIPAEANPVTTAAAFAASPGARPELLDEWVEAWAARYTVVRGSSPRPPCC